MSAASHTVSLLLPRLFFFFNDPATTEIYTLSLHDALPISRWTIPTDLVHSVHVVHRVCLGPTVPRRQPWQADRKSTRLNSSHVSISYAVFCLKKKKKRNPAAAPTADRYPLGPQPRHLRRSA